MLINFAIGVATGLVQEFQFGMNWSVYSKYVGNIFGAPLAIEGLAAFFLESTFLGLWIFGWDRLSKRVHLVTIWLAALGTGCPRTSSSWRTRGCSTAGYKVVNGQAQLTNVWTLLTSKCGLLGVRAHDPRRAGVRLRRRVRHLVLAPPARAQRRRSSGGRRSSR